MKEQSTHFLASKEGPSEWHIHVNGQLMPTAQDIKEMEESVANLNADTPKLIVTANTHTHKHLPYTETIK